MTRLFIYASHLNLYKPHLLDSMHHVFLVLGINNPMVSNSGKNEERIKIREDLGFCKYIHLFMCS